MSPKPRQSDRDLPACVYRKHGAYWLVKHNRWRRLGQDRRTAMIAYARLSAVPNAAMARLVDDAMVEIEARIRPATLAQYRKAAEALKAMLIEFEPEQVTEADVAGIRRAYRGRPNMGNRVLSVLRQVFAYAVDNRIVRNNPCIGIKRHKERKRDRLISWPEFHAIRSQASARMQTIMDLLVTTGQRPMDVVRLRRSDLSEEGISFKQAKTGAKLLVRWTPDMRAAVERAKALQGTITTLSLFQTWHARQPSYKAIYDDWRRACARAGVEDADLRDLRALSGTEAKRQGINPTALLGHTSETMTQRYLRDRDTPSVDGPRIRQPLDILDTK
jgi:integrase